MADHGGPAFPVTRLNNDLNNDGMTLRDWFAGIALSGLLSEKDERINLSDHAKRAYKVADEMLKARR